MKKTNMHVMFQQNNIQYNYITIIEHFLKHNVTTNMRA